MLRRRWAATSVAVLWSLVGALHIGGHGKHPDSVTGAMLIIGAWLFLATTEVVRDEVVRSR